MAAPAEIVTSNQSGKRPERIGIEMINSTLPGKPSNSKVNGQPINPTRYLPPPPFNALDGDLLRTGYKRIHGWPCVCTFCSPMEVAKYEALRERQPRMMLQTWGNSRYSYPPACRTIVPLERKAGVA